MSLCIIFFKFPITIKAKTGYFIIEYLVPIITTKA